jgi:hypothetical protein
MQKAQPDPNVFDAQTRAFNDSRVLDKLPGKGLPPGTTVGDTSLMEMNPLPTDWEWHMQSREGSIRFRIGPDDPRMA